MWKRPPGDARWHFVVVENNGGSTITECFGRWPITMADVERSASPPVEERCGGCTKLRGTAAVDFAFDMSEEDFV